MKSKQQQKAEEKGYVVEYTHERFPDGSVLTICLMSQPAAASIQSGGYGKLLVSRGLAICSPRDQFSKPLGRSISCGRALKAATLGMDCSLIVSRELCTRGNQALFRAWQSFGCKGQLRI